MRRSRPASRSLTLALVGATALLGCGSSTPEVEPPETVVDATPTAAPDQPKPRKPRNPERTHASIPVSATFPKGLDWVPDVPAELADTTSSDVSPGDGFAAENLAVKLAEQVAGGGTELVARGPTIVMRFIEGAQISVRMRMEPGRVYGAYGLGDDGVTEVELAFVVDPSRLSAGGGPGLGASLPIMTLAADTDVGPKAAIGVPSNGFRMSLPVFVPAVATVKAKGGSGLIALQLFEGKPE